MVPEGQAPAGGLLGRQSWASNAYLPTRRRAQGVSRARTPQGFAEGSLDTSEHGATLRGRVRVAFARRLPFGRRLEPSALNVDFASPPPNEEPAGRTEELAA